MNLDQVVPRRGARPGELRQDRVFSLGADLALVGILPGVAQAGAPQVVQRIVDHVQHVQAGALGQVKQDNTKAQGGLAGGAEVGGDEDAARAVLRPRPRHPDRTGTAAQQPHAGAAEQRPAQAGFLTAAGDDQVVPVAHDLADDLVGAPAGSQKRPGLDTVLTLALDQLSEHLRR
jgi:hypothetical protein